MREVQGPTHVRRGIRAMILLGGSVRASDLSRSIQRPILDLPIEAGISVLDLWARHLRELAGALELAQLPVRVIIDKGGARPRTPEPDPLAPIEIEEEAASFRGTGGVLRDATMRYEPDDLVLVANASQVLAEPLATKVQDLIRTRADVALFTHDDGAPTGVFLLRCSAVRAVKDVGFVDFKEQVLPRLAQTQDVRVVTRTRATGLPVRTREAYLNALRYHHRIAVGRAAEAGDPFAEDWSPTFAVVEPGASVAADARLHDSVVLSGGTVESGAVVVRCVIAPGGIVRGGQVVSDQVVTGARTRGGRP